VRPSGPGRRPFEDGFDRRREFLVVLSGNLVLSSLRSFFAFRSGRGVLDGRDRMVDDTHNLRIVPLFGYRPAAARKRTYWTFAIEVRQLH
jgi:hypothetical protein